MFLKESNLLTWTLTLSLLTGWKTPSRTEDPLLGTCSIPPWLAQEPTLKYGNKHSSLQKYQFLSWVTPNEYVQWQWFRRWFRLLLINNQFNTTWSMIQSRLLGYDIQSNLAISNSVNSKSPLFRRKIECPWIYPSPLRFPGYFEARLFRTFFHFPSTSILVIFTF